ncbi:hypothetical protein IGI04_013795 [Brassica rapa subsp. trilocularis]|uniref:FBD domain-containing protein n=1 Tax=Brassica rapa subsp. trilocularis TaxID=1813537 RepID=A0ABQ7NBZ7_BRACM|nr:hypothetical protein IGI04_013795 [Brassica rapa subsp. trilocularis]
MDLLLVSIPKGLVLLELDFFLYIRHSLSNSPMWDLVCYLTCFSDLEDFWDDLPFSRLEVVWTSSGLLGSLLTKSSGLPRSRLDFSERFGFSDLEDFWDDLPVSRLEVVWKSSGSRLDFLKVVWTSCKVKSSGLLRSRLDFLKVFWSCLLKWNPSLPFRQRLVLHLTGLFQKFDFLDDLHFSHDLQLSRHRLVLQLKKKTSRFNYIQTTYNSVVHETTEIIRLNFQSSQVTDFKVNCKNNLCVDQTTSSLQPDDFQVSRLQPDDFPSKSSDEQIWKKTRCHTLNW